MRVGKKYASARVLLAAGAMVLVAAPALAAPQLTVFGDSYSIPVHDGTRDWPLLLQDAGIVGRVNDFARFGATASSGWHITSRSSSSAGTTPAARSGERWSISASTTSAST